MIAEVQKGVDAANEHLARVEQIKKFTIVRGDWLPGGDELTPTMKLKRKPIAAKYERRDRDALRLNPGRPDNAMVKLIFAIRRREDLSQEEFHRYWLEEHGPLARGLLEALGATGYVQSHSLGDDLNAALAATRGTAEPYDGVAEVSWESLDALMAASGSEEGQRINETLREDEARFIDFERSSFFITEEHRLIG